MVSELLLEEHGEDDGVGVGERPEDKLNMWLWILGFKKNNQCSQIKVFKPRACSETLRIEEKSKYEVKLTKTKNFLKCISYYF